MNKYAIIVAGGSGKRMDAIGPKQFLLLNQKPIVLYSLEAFYKYSSDIEQILVLHPTYISLWEGICNEFQITIPHKVVVGGETRFHSVKNGLDSISTEGLVAVHDAARPMINSTFIEKLFTEAALFDSAIPGIAVNDTIRQMDRNATQQLDRNTLRAIQTPQVFKVSDLKKAYQQDYAAKFTDDASVMQSAGYSLHITEGLQANIKVTYPNDLILAEALLNVYNK